MSPDLPSWEEALAFLPYPDCFLTRLALLAQAAKETVQCLRRCFPVAGELWPFAGSHPNLAAPQVVEVLGCLVATEQFLNPAKLPFDAPGRRDVFGFPDGCLLPGAACAIAEAKAGVRSAVIILAGRVVAWFDLILRHYRLEEIVTTHRGPLLKCGWTYPDVPVTAGTLLDGLDRDAEQLLIELAHDLPLENALLKALGQDATPRVPAGSEVRGLSSPVGIPALPQAAAARLEDVGALEAAPVIQPKEPPAVASTPAPPSDCGAPSPEGTAPVTKGAEAGSGATKQHRLSEWAFGIAHGGNRGDKWHVFKRHRGEWMHHAALSGLKAGLQARLLKAFAEGGGSLSMIGAIRQEAPGCPAGERDTIKGRIKPEVSKIRGVLRAAMGIKDPKADPLPFDENSGNWQAVVGIGYAVEDDGDHIGGERRLRFKLHQQLTDDEQLDLV